MLLKFCRRYRKSGMLCCVIVLFSHLFNAYCFACSSCFLSNIFFLVMSTNYQHLFLPTKFLTGLGNALSSAFSPLQCKVYEVELQSLLHGYEGPSGIGLFSEFLRHKLVSDLFFFFTFSRHLFTGLPQGVNLLLFSPPSIARSRIFLPKSSNEHQKKSAS